MEGNCQGSGEHGVKKRVGPFTREFWGKVELRGLAGLLGCGTLYMEKYKYMLYSQFS